MKRHFLVVLTTLSLLGAATPANALPPAHDWSQRFGSTASDQGHSVAVDGAGNVVVTGFFEGTVDFGGGPLVSAGGYDIFLAQYRAAVTGVGGTPRSYVLSLSNHPNPFNPSTTLTYTVPVHGNVTVAIYDARGARVATLVRDEVREAGPHRMEWDGRTDAGAAVPSGIYFARIDHNGAVRSKKMVLLK